MSDLSDELAARLAGNEELARSREAAQAEMAKVDEQKEAEAEALLERQRARHAELAAHLEASANQLKASAPDRFIVRMGWTASGEEFVAKMKTRQMDPKRSLLVEVDRDDDEVLARWTSDIGSAIEVWRLLEIDTRMLTDLVLQLADDGQWRGRRPPRRGSDGSQGAPLRRAARRRAGGRCRPRPRRYGPPPRRPARTGRHRHGCPARTAARAWRSGRRTAPAGRRA